MSDHQDSARPFFLEPCVRCGGVVYKDEPHDLRKEPKGRRPRHEKRPGPRHRVCDPAQLQRRVDADSARNTDLQRRRSLGKRQDRDSLSADGGVVDDQPRLVRRELQRQERKYFPKAEPDRGDS